MIPTLTKAYTVSLWYAVDAYASMVKAMNGLPSPVAPDVIDKELQVLAAAKRALRKVNAIRKGQAEILNLQDRDGLTARLQVRQVESETAGGAGP
ncbi:hypothetical protein [Simplicispira piscis]